VLPGDEIRRKLPNGTEEAFQVIDPVFYNTGIGSMGSHFQIKVKRKGAFEPHTGGNYNLNVTGSNARVNIGSTDQSTNIAIEGDIFGQIGTALKSGINDQEALKVLIDALDDMKRKKGQSGFVVAYQKFVSLAADHIGLIGPFLPALTNLIR
jgi:hypothetical protein